MALQGKNNVIKLLDIVRYSFALNHLDKAKSIVWYFSMLMRLSIRNFWKLLNQNNANYIFIKF